MSLFALIDRIDRMLIDLGPSGAAIRPHFFTLRDQLEAFEKRPKPRNNKVASEQQEKANKAITRLRRKLTSGNEESKKDLWKAEARHATDVDALKQQQSKEVTRLNASLARFSAEIRQLKEKQAQTDAELSARADRIVELENFIRELRKKTPRVPGDPGDIPF